MLRRALALRLAIAHASEPDPWAIALLAGRLLGARVALDVHEHHPSRLGGWLPAALRPLGRAALRLLLALMGHMADAVVAAKDGLEADFPGARCLPARNRAILPLGLRPRERREGPLTLLHLGAITRARG